MGWDDGDDAWRFQVISTPTTYFSLLPFIFFPPPSTHLFFYYYYYYYTRAFLGLGLGRAMEWNGTEWVRVRVMAYS
jgi:hypothetical protein